jgi:hypothetical protein
MEGYVRIRNRKWGDNDKSNQIKSNQIKSNQIKYYKILKK